MGIFHTTHTYNKQKTQKLSFSKLVEAGKYDDITLTQPYTDETEVPKSKNKQLAASESIINHTFYTNCFHSRCFREKDGNTLTASKRDRQIVNK